MTAAGRITLTTRLSAAAVSVKAESPTPGHGAEVEVYFLNGCQPRMRAWLEGPVSAHVLAEGMGTTRLLELHMEAETLATFAAALAGAIQRADALALNTITEADPEPLEPSGGVTSGNMDYGTLTLFRPITPAGGAVHGG